MGRGTGWSSWTSRTAVGQPPDPEQPDLPGVLRGLRVHEATLPTGSGPAAPAAAEVAVKPKKAAKVEAGTDEEGSTP